MGKKFYNSLKIGPNFFFSISKIKLFSVCEIYGYKKGITTNFFHPSHPLPVAVFGSGMGRNQDPGTGMGKNQDPG
jgi:hypothetical protein